MPRSVHSNTARLRSAYSGERYTTSLRTVGRDGDLNVDTSSVAQRRFRAQLAYYLFNTTPDGTYGQEAVPALTIYPFVASPRYNEFVIISGAERNIAKRLLPIDLCQGSDGNPDAEGRTRYERAIVGVPGMRLINVHSRSWWMLHVPTGAKVLVTGNQTTNRWNDDRAQPSDNFPRWEWSTDNPLTTNEIKALDSIPPMSDSMEQLLAAMVSRLYFRDAQGTWDYNWHWDSIQRVNKAREPALPGPMRRRLTGHDHHWCLQWRGLPYASDIAAMLTHSTIGLSGTRMQVRGVDAFDVLYKESVLELRPSDG